MLILKVSQELFEQALSASAYLSITLFWELNV